MKSLLIVEDESHLAQGLQFNLEQEGYKVKVVDDGEKALALLLQPLPGFDAVVLDVMLPGKSGFEVVAELRLANRYLPILLLTARSRPEDILKGFEAGADDYLPKPFDLAILLARIRGLLRRREWALRALEDHAIGAGEMPDREVSDPSTVFTFEGKTIDFGELELRISDMIFHLTVMEAELLRHLVQNNGRTVSRKSLLEEVWGVREDTDTRAIDNFIVRLRRYIEDEPSKPRHLLTVRGVGYRFVATPDPSE